MVVSNLKVPRASGQHLRWTKPGGRQAQPGFSFLRRRSSPLPRRDELDDSDHYQQNLAQSDYRLRVHMGLPSIGLPGRDEAPGAILASKCSGQNEAALAQSISLHRNESYGTWQIGASAAKRKGAGPRAGSRWGRWDSQLRARGVASRYS